MFEICSDRLRDAFSRARDSAERLLHEQISTEHLLLGLLGDYENQACHILRSEFKTDPVELRMQLSELLVPGNHSTVRDLPFTPAAREVLGRTAILAQEFGHNRIGTDHLLLALTTQDGTLAGKTLRRSNVSLENLRDVVAATTISDGIFRTDSKEAPPPFFHSQKVYTVCVAFLFLGPAALLLSLNVKGLSAVVFVMLIAMVVLVHSTFDTTLKTGVFRARPVWGNLVKGLAVLHAAAAITIAITTLKDGESTSFSESQIQHWVAVAWCWFAAAAGYMAGDAQIAIATDPSKLP